MTRVLVTGGRDYPDRERVFRVLDEVNSDTPISMLIHGCCVDPQTGEIRGADRWAEEWAKSREVPYFGVPARWQALGDGAGPVRNGWMLEKGKPQKVVTFPGGRGTADMVKKVRAENDRRQKAGVALPEIRVLSVVDR